MLETPWRLWGWSVQQTMRYFPWLSLLHILVKREGPPENYDLLQNCEEQQFCMGSSWPLTGLRYPCPHFLHTSHLYPQPTQVPPPIPTPCALWIFPQARPWKSDLGLHCMSRIKWTWTGNATNQPRHIEEESKNDNSSMTFRKQPALSSPARWLQN